jgi:hypothetical protein
MWTRHDSLACFVFGLFFLQVMAVVATIWQFD